MPPDADPTPRTNLVDSLAHRMDLPDRQAVAALDQMSWHVFCCYYLLAGFNNEIKDALGAAVEPEFLREMGSRIAELRTDVETALAEISVRHFGSMCCSSAESFQEELDATSDPQSILYPNADFAPQCQKVGGKGVRGCTRHVLYIGGGEWSEGCEAHAFSGDRDRHKQWQNSRDGTPGGEARLHQSRQLTEVAKLLLDWWPTVDCIDSVIRDARRESQA